MNYFKWLLFPLTLIYGSIVRLRNHLFDIDYYKSFEFQTNIIAVGNLTVGGTGKTPMVEYLIRLLSKEYNVSTLSRGYGRKTRGFKKGDIASSTPHEIGDEPFQYLLKYTKMVNIFVGEERALAIPNILHECPETQIILLDDAYQHRTVKPSLNILLSTYDRPFYEDHILPSGRLREQRKGANRADVVIITKCPKQVNMEEFKENLLPYLENENTPVFFTAVTYGKLTSFDGIELDNFPTRNFVLVTGIANANDFKHHLVDNGEVLHHFEFPDHHHYKLSDVSKINNKFEGKDTIFITTEKDFAKLREFKKELRDLPFFYIPIEIELLDNKFEFDQLIRKSIQSYEIDGGENG